MTYHTGDVFCDLHYGSHYLEKFCLVNPAKGPKLNSWMDAMPPSKVRTIAQSRFICNSTEHFLRVEKKPLGG